MNTGHHVVPGSVSAPHSDPEAGKDGARPGLVHHPHRGGFVMPQINLVVSQILRRQDRTPMLAPAVHVAEPDRAALQCQRRHDSEVGAIVGGNVMADTEGRPHDTIKRRARSLSRGAAALLWRQTIEYGASTNSP